MTVANVRTMPPAVRRKQRFTLYFYQIPGFPETDPIKGGMAHLRGKPRSRI